MARTFAPIALLGSWMSKLTEAQVLEIRRRAATGETHTSLAKEFGIERGGLSCAVRGDTWAHVKNPKAS